MSKETKRNVTEMDAQKAFDSYMAGVISFEEYARIRSAAASTMVEDIISRNTEAGEILCTAINAEKAENKKIFQKREKVKAYLRVMSKSEDKKKSKVGKDLTKMFEMIINGTYQKRRDRDSNVITGFFGTGFSDEEAKKYEELLMNLVDCIDQIPDEELADAMPPSARDVSQIILGKKHVAKDVRIKELMANTVAETEEDQDKLAEAVESGKEKLTEFKDKLSSLISSKDKKKGKKSPFELLFGDDEDEESPLKEEKNAAFVKKFMKESITKMPDKKKKAVAKLQEFFDDYLKMDNTDVEKKYGEKTSEAYLSALEEILKLKPTEEKKEAKKVGFESNLAKNTEKKPHIAYQYLNKEKIDALKKSNLFGSKENWMTCLTRMDQYFEKHIKDFDEKVKGTFTINEMYYESPSNFAFGNDECIIWFVQETAYKYPAAKSAEFADAWKDYMSQQASKTTQEQQTPEAATDTQEPTPETQEQQTPEAATDTQEPTPEQQPA